jgi:hypothetical protein
MYVFIKISTINDARDAGKWVAGKAIADNPVAGYARVGVSPPGFLKIFKY